MKDDDISVVTVFIVGFLVGWLGVLLAYAVGWLMMNIVFDWALIGSNKGWVWRG